MKLKPRTAFLAVALLVVLAYGATQWTAPGGSAPARPSKMKTTPQADGRDQVIMRLWWSPTNGAPASVQWTAGDRTTTTVVDSAPASTPFERRSILQPGTKVVLGVASVRGRPNQRWWELWEAGKLVRHGMETGNFTVIYVTTGA